MSKEPSILDDINDVAEQKQAIADFRALIKTPGWRRISKYYQDLANYYQQQINGDVEEEIIKNMADLKLARFKKGLVEKHINLPDILIGIIEMQQEEIEFDPHFKPEDFNDKLE